MKLVVLVALVAAAAAQYTPGQDADATILVQDFQEAVDRSFSYQYETSNEIKETSVGESLPGPEPETGTLRRSGTYSYVTPEGQQIVVTWTADELGYRVQSDAVPAGADGQAAAQQAPAAL